MPSLFSSPSSQAAAASSGVQNADNSEIAQQQQYVNSQEGQLRGAIAGLGPNPYFAAAGNMSPARYAVNPSNAANFFTAAPSAPAPIQAQNLFAAPRQAPAAMRAAPGKAP